MSTLPFCIKEKSVGILIRFNCLEKSNLDILLNVSFCVLCKAEVIQVNDDRIVFFLFFFF